MSNSRLSPSFCFHNPQLPLLSGPWPAKHLVSATFLYHQMADKVTDQVEHGEAFSGKR